MFMYQFHISAYMTSVFLEEFISAEICTFYYQRLICVALQVTNSHERSFRIADQINAKKKSSQQHISRAGERERRRSCRAEPERQTVEENTVGRYTPVPATFQGKENRLD